jgi:adenine-specific DNA-methyltransferase
MNRLNYIGCKHTLYNTLLEVCKDNVDGMSNKSFMDLFAGTGVVGFNMQEIFKSCDANDIEYYSYIINYALLKCNYTENIKKIIDDCNKVELVDGLIYKNFTPNEQCERMFFTNNNARKTDAIRQYIQQQLDNNLITLNEFNFVLASLIVSVDKVANTSCVYGAYLKEYKKTAQKDLVLLPIHQNQNITENNSVFNEFAENFAKPDSKFYDVVYMDPPYNQRQYSANYSPLNYIAHYDKNIVLNGKTALIDGYNKSNFCKKTEVKDTFTKLISGINCNILIISYNNEGLLSVDEFKEILLKKGFVKLYKIQYNKFKAQQSVDKKYVEEYLWVIDTTKKGNFIEIEYELIKQI